ncbi:hypothetical protein EVAR_75834_1 [Eumeta japonica]|uniref:Uncharacterized protein n=1 Tax=Eumeta variegata TaxID=151549 RepID=A0A4C1TFS0_EUMVA|nr:hypothetical protein EVAR_75834_1 [Eumeta japonica]
MKLNMHRPTRFKITRVLLKYYCRRPLETHRETSHVSGRAALTSGLVRRASRARRGARPARRAPASNLRIINFENDIIVHYALTAGEHNSINILILCRYVPVYGSSLKGVAKTRRPTRRLRARGRGGGATSAALPSHKSNVSRGTSPSSTLNVTLSSSRANSRILTARGEIKPQTLNGGRYE